MARLQRVFIDTSELFPFTIMDVLLTLAEDFLFTWVWTDQLLDEWTEIIVREGKRTPESAASVAAAVRAHFGRDRIDDRGFLALQINRFQLRAANAGDDDFLDLRVAGRLLGEGPAGQGQLRRAGDQRQRQSALEHGFPCFL